MKNHLYLLLFIFITISPIPLLSQDYTQDSLAVRAILDANGSDYYDVLVTQVSVKENGRIVSVNFYSKMYMDKFTTLSPEIGKLTALKRIDGGSADIRSISGEISKCTELEYIHIYGDRYSTFQSEIWSITSLKHMYVAGWEFPMLPQEFGNLINLEYFNANRTRLTEIPADIGNLVSLKTLILEYNFIAAVPDEICNCISLKNLNIAANSIKALPEDIGNLINLDTLNISKNGFNTLPESIKKLTGLKCLQFWNADNKMDTIPEEIWYLTSLEELSLSSNSLKSVPPEIEQLAQIKRLSLRNNELLNLPIEITALSPDESCDFGYNYLSETVLRPEVVTWLDTYDSDWRATQKNTGIQNSKDVTGKNIVPILNKLGNSILRLTLPLSGSVKIEVLDFKGRLITTLLDSHKKSGIYYLTLNNEFDVSSAYLIKLSMGNYSTVKKFVTIR